LIRTERKPDYRFLGSGKHLFPEGSKQDVGFEPDFTLGWLERRKGLDLIRITKSKKLKASDPPETLPSGHYMQFDSVDDPAEYLLFARSGKVYRVKKKELKDAKEQGYVKA
jgi:hypothetical protein